MKKQHIKPILLIAFAVIAGYISWMPGSVAVYALAETAEPFYCTYFTLVEDVRTAIALPVAGLCACGVLLLSGICLAMKKYTLLPAIGLISLAGATLAVIPVLVKDAVVQLVPNVLMPIALLGVWVTAFYLNKEKNAPVATEKLKRKKKK